MIREKRISNFIFLELVDRLYTDIMENGHGGRAWREMVRQNTHPNIAR